MDIKIGNNQPSFISKALQNKKGITDVFSETLKDKVAENVDKLDGFFPKSSEQVINAFNKTLKETGINPFQMDKISTALVIHTENGGGDSSSFLGNTVTSAKKVVEQIIRRLENPLAPSEDADFSKKELLFYKAFLENLKLTD